jgi:hypothetical protein
MLGQVSAEFLVLFSILSIIFVIFFASSQGYQFYSENLKIKKEHKDICNQIKFEIETALEVGPTYNRSFYLPQGGYSASILNRDIVISYSGGEIVCSIPVNVSANLIQGKNTIIYNETGFFIK